MKGDLQATSARLPAAVPRWRLPSFITKRKQKRRRDREEQLVQIEALAREERNRRRSGEYRPDVGSARRWY